MDECAWSPFDDDGKVAWERLAGEGTLPVAPKQSDNPVFVVNLGMVHLVIEQAASQAAAREVERQYFDQFGERLAIDDLQYTVPGLSKFDLSIPGVDVAFKDEKPQQP